MMNLLLAALETTTSTAAATSGEGSNQIVQIADQFGIKPYLLLAQIINFTLVACILYFFVIKPIQAKLDERAKLIDDGLKRSEESNKILADAQAQKEKIITDARREAQAIVERSQKELQSFEAKKRQEAQQEAAQLLEAAVRSAAQEKEHQLQRAQNDIKDLVIKLAEKSLEENLTEDQKQRFAQRVSQAMAST